MAGKPFMSIDVAGDQALRDAMGRLQQGVEDPRDVLQAIGTMLEANVQERFQAKVDPAGQAWAPLADSTRAGYERADAGRSQGSLLERSGLMLASLSSRADADGVTVGFGRPYSLYHETGTERGGLPYMPRRGMLTADPDAGTLGAQDEADVIAEITAWLESLA